MFRFTLKLLFYVYCGVFLSGSAALAQDVAALPAPQAASVAIEQPSAATVHDLSVVGMYRAAQPVVRGIIIVLLLCSVLTWTICVVKLLQLFLSMRRIRREYRGLAPVPSLGDCRDVINTWRRSHAAAQLLHDIDDEIQRSGHVIDGDLPDRVEYRLDRRAHEQVQRLRYGIGPLATIGSVAPFIGLFGTVWGIMNSFTGIASAETVSLAVVAPGIAEALFATAIGLVAAIPAVILYNLFLRKLHAYQFALGNVVSILFLMFKRDLSLNRPLFDHEPATVLSGQGN